MNTRLTFDLPSDVHQLLAYQFMVNALEAASVVAVMAAVVGWFMVLRRETFAGHTLSMMSFPGAAAAALAGLPLAAGYFAFCGAGAVMIAGAAQGGGAAGVLAFLAVAGRPLFFASVDGPLAGASRVPVRALSVAFLLVLGLAVAATVQITGVLLVVALLEIGRANV